MQPIFLIILVGLLGGMAIGVQSPLSSIMSQRLGMIESSFIIHLSGAIAALILLLVFGNRLGEWRSVPWYVLGAGALGLIVISSMGYMIPRIGVAGALITLLAGQLLVGSFLDHFGLLGATQRTMDIPRLIGLGVVMLGVWLTVK